MKRRKTPLIQALITLVALSSCATNPTPAPQPLPPPTFNATHFENSFARIMISSPDLQNKISCDPPISRMRGSLLYGQVTCRNTSYTPVQLEYKFEWYEEDNFHISSPNAWHSVFLEPGETQSLVSTAKSPAAKLFEITIRTPRNEF